MVTYDYDQTLHATVSKTVPRSPLGKLFLKNNVETILL